MANSFTYGGTDLSTYNLKVVDYDIPEMASIDFNTHTAMEGDSAFTSINHQVRTISIECAVSGNTPTALQTNMDAIKGILNPILTDKVITIDDITERQFLGRVRSIGTPSVKGKSVKVFTIQIECIAEMFATEETESSTAIATDPDTLTISTVTGNAHRQPVALYVRNQTGGTLTGQTVSVSNDTTNETLTGEVTIQNGFWLQIGALASNGTFTAVLKMSTTSGSDPDALTFIDVISMYTSGDWPRLKGGVDNDITVTGISTGTLQWKYRARYL